MVISPVEKKVKEVVPEILPPLDLMGGDKGKGNVDKTIDTLDKVERLLDKAAPLVERLLDKIAEQKEKKKPKSTGDPQADYFEKLKDLGIGETQG